MFIYNFTRYTEWPLGTEGSTFRIGVIGSDDMFNALSAMAKQKQINNIPIEVIRLQPGENTYCRIVFIGREETSGIEELSRKWTGKGVLIISEKEKHHVPGTVINLVMIDNKVRFQIYESFARTQGIKISSELLKMAVEINP
jgi:hypothetical protein